MGIINLFQENWQICLIPRLFVEKACIRYGWYIESLHVIPDENKEPTHIKHESREDGFSSAKEAIEDLNKFINENKL